MGQTSKFSWNQKTEANVNSQTFEDCSETVWNENAKVNIGESLKFCHNSQRRLNSNKVLDFAEDFSVRENVDL